VYECFVVRFSLAEDVLSKWHRACQDRQRIRHAHSWLNHSGLRDYPALLENRGSERRPRLSTKPLFFPRFTGRPPLALDFFILLLQWAFVGLLYGNQQRVA
jgi:hypothetical protein